MRYLLILLYLIPSSLLAQEYISDAEKIQLNRLSDLASHIPAYADYLRKKGNYFGFDLDLQRPLIDYSSNTLEQLSAIGGSIPTLWLAYNHSARRSQHGFSFTGTPKIELLDWKIRNIRLFYNYLKSFSGRKKKSFSFAFYLDQLIVERMQIVEGVNLELKYTTQIVAMQMGSAHLIYKSSRSKIAHYIGGHLSYYQRLINRNSAGSFGELNDSSGEFAADIRYSFCRKLNCWVNGFEYSSNVRGKFISNISIRF